MSFCFHVDNYKQFRVSKFNYYCFLRDTLFKNQHRTTKQLKRCTFFIMNFCRKFVQNGYPKVTKKWENPHLFTA